MYSYPRSIFPALLPFHPDGSVILAIQRMNSSGLPGSLYYSRDYGANWLKDFVLNASYWEGVAVSGDGSVFMVTEGANSSSGIYYGTFRPVPPVGIAVAAAAAVGIGVGVAVGEYEPTQTNKTRMRASLSVALMIS